MTRPRRLLAGCAGLLVVAAFASGGMHESAPVDSRSSLAPTYGQAAAEARTTASCLRRASEDATSARNTVRRCGASAREAEMIQLRDEWFYGRRLEGESGRRTYLEAGADARALREASLAAGEAPLTWTELGPHPIGTTALPWDYGGRLPYSGRVTSIATHPSDRRTAYIGTSNGGVWKTTDDGASWTPLFDDQLSLAIGAVAVDPNDPDVVFAGTGESNFGGPSYFGAGLFKSVDGGTTWRAAGGSRFLGCHFSGVVVEPGDGQTVIVSAHGIGSSVWEFWGDRCDDEGVWKSTDGGVSFEPVLRSGPPTDLAVAPNDSSVWFAGIGGRGIWKSTDSGTTWTRVDGLPSRDTGRVELDVQASTSAPTQVVYAAIERTYDDLKGVYRSDDSGETWAGLARPDRHCAYQCSYNLTLAADPANPDRAFFGGVYLNRYVKGTPTTIGWNKIHVDFHALTFDAAGRLWIGGDGGVYRTSDGGTKFSNLNSDLGTNLVYPGMSGSYAGPLYAGFQDNGTAAYTGSTAWRFVNWGDGFFTATDPARPNPVYVTSQFLSLIKIVDGRRCPYFEARGLPDAGRANRAPFQAPLVMHPRDRKVAYAGTYRIFKTANADSTKCFGTDWSRVSQTFDAPVTAIAPAPSDGKTVYAATERFGPSGGVWVTRGSKKWTSTGENGLPERTVTDVAVHPTEPGTAWAVLTGFAGSGEGHVYRTTDFGGSWTDVSRDMPNAPTNAIVVDARSDPLTLYVGTDAGVFWSTDEGATWNDTSVDLPNTVVMDLVLDPVADRLIAGTFGRGVWSAPLTDVE